MIGLNFVGVFNLAMLANCAFFLWLRWSGWNYSVYTRLILPAQLLLLLASFLVGCGGIVESAIDPAGYTQRTQAQADAQQAQADAQKAFAESQSELAQSEAQRAQADAQARQAEANADAEAVKAQSQAFSDMGNQIKKAAEVNKSLVVIAMLLLVGFGVFAVWNMRRVTEITMQAQVWKPPLQLAPPPQVILIAQKENLTPVHDGQRWLLIDENGTIVQRQKLLA